MAKETCRKKGNRQDVSRMKQTIRRLRVENRELHAENKRLRNAGQRDLSFQESTFRKDSDRDSLPASKIRASVRKEALYRKKTVFGYALSAVKSTLLYGLILKAVTFFRRFRLVRTVFRVLAALIALLETGTLLLALTAVSALLLPLLLVSLLLLLQIPLARFQKQSRLIKEELNGRDLYVFFLPGKDGLDHNLFFSLLRRLSAEENTTVLAVSPYLFLKKGIPREDGTAEPFYLTIRKEAPHLFLLRGYCYFSLKRSLFPSADASVTVFY